ncbi:MAG: MFS transporter [Sphaerobacter sp.]|nr:MFS transporter [Sphaerobacter sp.]
MSATTDATVTGTERSAYRRNPGLGIANGALRMLGETLIYPTMVLALFVSQLTRSNLLVGLVPVLASTVWLLPQIDAATGEPGRSRGLAQGVWASAVSAAALGVLGMPALVVGAGRPSVLLVTFFLTYTIHSLATGFAHVPLGDVLARAVPVDRLGVFFSQRNLWGGLLGILAGFLIYRVLSRLGTFPANYALLFVLAGASLALATYAAARLQEPPRPTTAEPIDLRAQLGAAPRLLRQAPVRRFLAFRALLSTAAIADPFYVVYAHRQLGAPDGVIGIYIAALLAGRFGANLVWGRVADRQGSRLVLQLAALLRMAIPLLALALPPLLRWSPVARLEVVDSSTLVYAYGLLFVVYGASLSGQALANMAFLLDLAPAHRRAACVVLVNAVLGIVACAPILGGALVDRFGFQFLFLLAFLVGLAAVLASGALPEPRIRGAAPRGGRYLLSRARRLRG